MPEGLVPRMAIEWAFLILLAVGAALADLRPGYIVLVMVVGWILVVLVELLSWRARPRYEVVEGPVEEAPPTIAEAMPPPPVAAPPPEPPPVAAPPPEPPPAVEPAPVPVADETAVVPTAAAPEAGYDFEFTKPKPAEEKTEVFVGAPAADLDPDHPYAPAPERERLLEHDQRAVYRLEPLRPRPRRKYRWFGGFLPRDGEKPVEPTVADEGETEGEDGKES